MTKWHAHFVHMAKHMNMVGDPVLWGALGQDPPKSGAASKTAVLKLFHLADPEVIDLFLRTPENAASDE